LHLHTTQQPAAVVRLTYAGGAPFVFEAYELYRPGVAAPEQVGHTNARGELVFVPGAQAQWRLKAWSADGHGVDQVLTVPVAAEAGPGVQAVTVPAPPAPGGPRLLLLACGLALVFGVFGVVQLLVRRKRT
jgi:nickel transport protein